MSSHATQDSSRRSSPLEAQWLHPSISPGRHSMPTWSPIGSSAASPSPPCSLSAGPSPTQPLRTTIMTRMAILTMLGQLQPNGAWQQQQRHPNPLGHYPAHLRETRESAKAAGLFGIQGTASRVQRVDPAARLSPRATSITCRPMKPRWTDPNGGQALFCRQHLWPIPQHVHHRPINKRTSIYAGIPRGEQGYLLWSRSRMTSRI